MTEGKGEILQSSHRKFGLNPNAINWDKKLNPKESAGAIIINTSEKIYNKIYKDGLTGIYNRKAWEDFINKIDYGRGDKFSLIILDFDNLKGINDRLGHHVGDAYLKTGVEYLQSVFSRKTDSLYRLGGDEIGIICQFVEGEDRETFAKYISESLNRKKIKSKGINFSYGIAFSSENEASPLETIKQADKKMYQNKNSWKKQNPPEHTSR